MKIRAASVIRRMISIAITAVMLAGLLPEAALISRADDDDAVLVLYGSTINEESSGWDYRPSLYAWICDDEDRSNGILKHNVNGSITDFYTAQHLPLRISSTATVGEVKAMIMERLLYPGYTDRYNAICPGLVINESNPIKEFVEKADTAKARPLLVDAEDFNCIHLQWKKASSSDKTVRIKLNGGEPVRWFDTFMGACDFGDADCKWKTSTSGCDYEYTDKDHYPFLFPTVKKEGYGFGGWRLCGTGDKPELKHMGSTKADWMDDQQWIVTDDTYEAIWLSPMTEINLENVAGLPSAPEAGDQAVGGFSLNSGSNTVSLSFKGFKTHLSDGTYMGSSEAFADNTSYYAVYQIKGKNGNLVDDHAAVTLNGSRLTPVGGGLFYRRYDVGTVKTHRLILDLEGKAELPAFAANGFTFVESNAGIDENISDSDNDELNELYCDAPGDGKYVITGWYINDPKAAEDDFRDLDLSAFKSDVTVKAKWLLVRPVSTADFSIAAPAPGKTLGIDFRDSWLSDEDEQLICKVSDIFTDEDLSSSIIGTEKTEFALDICAATEAFIPDAFYYIRLDLDANEGWEIRNSNIAVQINGVRQTVLKDADSGEYYVIWKVKAEPSYCRLSLDLNYPDNTTDVGTINNIPLGTALDPVKAIRILKLTEVRQSSGGISYDAYKQLESALGDAGFENAHPSADVKVVPGYRLTDSYLAVPNPGDFGEYTSELLDMTEDLIPDTNEVIYCFWQKEIVSVELGDLSVPSCMDVYKNVKDGFTASISMGEDFTYESAQLLDKDDHVPDDENVFKGGQEYRLAVSGLKIYDPLNLGTLFDSYIGDNTKISYRGDEYQKSNDEKYYIPVKICHELSDNGTTEKKNVVDATCTEKGSYDEVVIRECIKCKEKTETSTHYTQNALGHNWGSWSVVKEPTETEDGLEERICLRDKTHKETRPKKAVKKDHTHKLRRHDRVEPSVTAEGSIEYWECEDETCKKLFSDAEGKNEISLADTVLDKLPAPAPDPDPAITPVPAAPVVEESLINEKPVRIEVNVTSPGAVTWTGDKITEEQLGVLSEDGSAAKVTITGLAEAITNMKKGTDPSKLYTITYTIKGKDIGKAEFKLKIRLNKKALRKAKIKGKDKKALTELIYKLNQELDKDIHYFEIMPINLEDDKHVSIVIKAALKKGKVQVNEADGTLKGLKSVTVKYKVPNGKDKKGNDKFKTRTYTYKKSKAKDRFVITVTDAAGKKASVTATSANKTFTGTRTGIGVKK
ncbi:MAG: hypothetical protein K6C95_02185 [Lachnospiraceae bacterium]|nr:hypothetical protein [Lachnospiraceae bacterium]